MPITEQVRPGFVNENTVWNLKQQGKLDEFHARYDEALKRARKELGRTYSLIINGKRVTSRGGTFDDTNPSNTKEIVGKFQSATAEETKDAIEAAAEAFPSWSGLAWKERVRIVRRVGDLLREQKYDFAAWMTLENGKPRIESMNDVDEAIDFCAYYPYWYEKNDAFHVTLFKPFPNEDCQSFLKPLGPWAVIAPFNFPVAITIGMTVGCILTGNTAVLKPASDTPLVAHRFMEVLEKAGVPKGVVNFVTGSGRNVGQTLLDSPEIRGVVFTGSREVGLRVIASGNRFARPSIIEMGGKNPILVTQKADLEKAVEGVARSAFGFSGQKCSAASRVFIHDSIYPEFTKRLVEWTKKNVNVGNPESKETFMGPIVNRDAVANYESFVAKAKKGGTILLGGKTVTKAPFTNGHFVEPTIVEGLGDDHWVSCNELFVPIVSLYRFKTLEEAVWRANAVEYGLTAGIFSEDAKEVQYFFDHVEAGVCYANRRIGGSTGAIVGGQSFGGWKHSSSTQRGAGGPWYLQQFCREQSQTRAS